MGFSLSTFVLQTINFVVLMLLLQRLVYRPLRAAVTERHERLAARENAAEERLRAAEALEAEYRRREAELAELRTRKLRDATEQAAEERARLLELAREEAAAERARARRVLEVEREAALGWVREAAVEHSVRIAGRLLTELAPDAVESALFERMLDAIRGHAHELEALQRRDPDAEVRVVVAKPLSDPAEARLRSELSRALGAEPRLVVKDERELGSGLVVHVGHLVLDASVAGQLDVLRERARELASGEAHAA